MIEVIRAGEAQLDALVPLFDGYRVFYKQDSNLKAARSFLAERLKNEESVIFMALENGQAVGFTQLYTTFSSVSLEAVFILNDLYVDTLSRKKGIGELLLEQAKAFCKDKGYKGLALETATDNPAQKLYERLGWEKDSHCFHYFWRAR
ncbi:MAG: N-acetyltransferase family protein [Flavobacteriaceae bacterium]